MGLNLFVVSALFFLSSTPLSSYAFIPTTPQRVSSPVSPVTKLNQHTSDHYLRSLEVKSRCYHRRRDSQNLSLPKRVRQSKKTVLPTDEKIVPIIILEQAPETSVRKASRRKSSENGNFETSNEKVAYNFTMIGGYDDVKEELVQTVDFLLRPEEYTKHNVRLPRGVLLYGPPGTGKTLLAKCLAGEAKVPFIATSGSSFQEKYVGTGAARVRELFTFAKTQCPCIVFIDELDAIGRHRSADNEGAHAERDQTLNQLLVELDGFDTNSKVVIVAATNRVDILDSALRRSGRMDRTIHVGLPDSVTRKSIVDIHRQGKPIDVPTEDIVELTSGMSGADIENLLNEVVLHAIRKKTLPVDQVQMEMFYDQMVVGRSVSLKSMSEDMLWRIAVHEMGHAFVSLKTRHHGPLRKVTIVSPSASAAGFTMFTQESNGVSTTREGLEERICVLLGGRACEELVFGVDGVSCGASEDLEACRQLAEQMVLTYGMGQKTVYPRFSEKSRESIDEEIGHIIQDLYKKTKKAVIQHMDTYLLLAKLLLEKKTLKYDDITYFLRSRQQHPQSNNVRKNK